MTYKYEINAVESSSGTLLSLCVSHDEVILHSPHPFKEITKQIGEIA